MTLLYRISVQLSVEPLIATRSATPTSLEQLPLYFYLIIRYIRLDCFDRSVTSQCALCNKTWIEFRKPFCLFQQ